MRTTILAAVAALAISTPAYAAGSQESEAASVLRFCHAGENSWQAGVCMGVATGAFEAVVGMQNAKLAPRLVCAPPTTTNGQIRDVLFAFLLRHPQALEESTGSLAAAAFMEAWPCRAPQPQTAPQQKMDYQF